MFLFVFYENTPPMRQRLPNCMFLIFLLWVLVFIDKWVSYKFLVAYEELRNFYSSFVLQIFIISEIHAPEALILMPIKELPPKNWSFKYSHGPAIFILQLFIRTRLGPSWFLSNYSYYFEGNRSRKNRNEFTQTILSSNKININSHPTYTCIFQNQKNKK